MEMILKFKYLAILFLIINVFASLEAKSQQVYKHQYLVKVGDQAPDFETELSNGTIFKLSEHRDKVVMIQFTASWCSVCRKEMPHIEKEIWQPLMDDDFIVIGMDYKEDKSKVLQFAKDMNITYPLGLDTDGHIFHKYAQEDAGVTRNIIIDKTGKIIFLTRLFEKAEFESMKSVIFNEVRPK